MKGLTCYGIPVFMTIPVKPMLYHLHYALFLKKIKSSSERVLFAILKWHFSVLKILDRRRLLSLPV